jgi:hypothetical protein
MFRSRAVCIASVMLCALAVSAGCTSAEDLYSKARCSDEVLADENHDAPKIMALSSGDIDDVEGRFSERSSLMYEAECNISDGDGNGFLTGRARYYAGKEYNPGLSLKEFFAGNFEGAPRRITSSSSGVEGVSGRDGGSVWAPCSMAKSSGFPAGSMVVTVTASSAPDGNSVKQRQNVADLAFSLLRYAVKKCDEPVSLPKKVKVQS